MMFTRADGTLVSGILLDTTSSWIILIRST